MKVDASELARNLQSVLERVELGGEEIVIVRNNHPIARIIPASRFHTAFEVLADLYKTLPEAAAKTWVEEGRVPGKLTHEFRDPSV